MAPKICSSLALFLTLSLLFSAFVSACNCGCNGSCHGSCPGSKPTPTPKPNPNPNPNPNLSGGSCPRDALKLGVCANVLNGLLDVTLGTQPPVTPCCSLLHALDDLDAVKCLCTALKANILGTNLHFPTSLTLLFNACDRKVPLDFHCA